ncbi:hypothetical protein [Joostella sp. CR20]|uniref:hypothetical protein n=1 Tax=Joostella sp. CR20 TaxID=2804312 RepID=UPI00313CBF21
MNHTLSKTYNIDTEIQKIQTVLYDELLKVWQGELDGYGRVYKNERDGKVIPEVWRKDKNNYLETLYNNKSCFFFIDGDEHTSEDGIVYSTSLKIAFMVNLNKVLPNEEERADASVKRDVIEVLRTNVFNGFQLTEGATYQKGIEQVFRGLDTSNLNFNDMQPLHVFAITGTLNYYVNNKC